MNPLLGRWISADPLAVHAPGEADFNLYAYVNGMVLKATDPLGLETVVSAQHSDEYPKSAGALGTARKLAQSMGVSKVGVHWKSKGLERQVAGGNIDRIDSVGHYASGFALEDNGYALDEGVAGRLAPHLTNDVKIVIHGCGVPSGRFANTERFLSKLGSEATLYTHRNKSGPGMPMNFVRHQLVNDGEGGKKLDSHLMSGSDKVIGDILSEDYVKWWTGKQSTGDLKRFMGDKEHFALTDDVRKVFQDELDSRQPASPNSENSYNGEGQSSGQSAESQSAAAGESSDENAEAD